MRLPPRFSAVSRLGDGAEGGAWEAVDTDAGRRVVLKRVPQARAAQVRAAFRLLRTVSSPHLPVVHELLSDGDGDLWLVTGFVAGRALAAGPVGLTQALLEAAAIAHALHAIHEAGTHHGDLSAANVLVTPEGGVVVTDFGQIGCFGCGTPGFLAPEVLAGGGGPGGDVFALGALLCLRLFGAVPWASPGAVVDALRRGPGAVLERVAELGAAAGVIVPVGVRALLVQLLHPDVRARLADLGPLPAHLRRLVAGEAGPGDRSEAPGPTWWLPARWPYRGGGLSEVVEGLVGGGRARLVAVAGPVGAGRGRVVEELIQSLQARVDAPTARVCVAERLGAALGGEHTAWLAAWIAGAPAEATVIGLPEAPCWPGELGEGVDDDDRAAQRAAVLVAAAAMAQVTLVVPVDDLVATALRRAEAAGTTAVLRVAPWDREVLAELLDQTLEPADERGAWVEVLMATAGGWPGATLRAIEACARLGLRRAEPSAVAAAASSALGELGAGQARLVLAASWSATATAPPEHAAHLFASDGQPLAWAVTAARRVLGPRLRALACAELEDMSRETGALPTLALAVDAEARLAVEQWLTQVAGDTGGAWECDPGLPGLIEWLLAGGATLVDADGRARVVASLLRAGEAGRAGQLAELGPASPRCSLLGARALEQTGRAEAALVRLAPLLVDREVPRAVQGAALGLRWRALTDLGRASEALAEARDALVEGTGELAEETGELDADPGGAEARLWAALAAMVCGEAEAAERWLVAAARRIGVDGPGGLRARVDQLRGNLEHLRGHVDAAIGWYERAASDFAAAGESIGRTLLAANLAALAIVGGDVERGLVHGRAALRGYLALGRVQALPELAVNLVQLLVRVGSLVEAQELGVLLRRLLAGSVGGPLAQARSRRVDAELAFGARLRGERVDVLAAFADAAQALAEAGATREAVEAGLRACGLARRAGRVDVAARHLAAARAIGDGAQELELLLLLGLESLALAAATGGRESFAAACAALARLPRPEALVAAGRLELAWRHDQVVAAILPAGDRRRRALERRMQETWDALMRKVPPLDRAAVRVALLAEAGERRVGAMSEMRRWVRASGERGESSVAGALEPEEQDMSEQSTQDEGGDPRASLADVLGDMSEAPVEAPRGGERHERLIRIYRRLAREDDLQRLLAQVVDAVMDLCDAERGAVVVVVGGERLEVARELAGSAGVAFSRSIIERVLEQGAAVLSVDAVADDRFDGSRSISHLNLRSVLAVPLLHRGEAIGAVYVDHRLRRGAWGEADLVLVEEFAELAALAIAHARTLAEQRAQGEALAAQGRELARLLEERELEVRGLREAARTPERRSYRGMVGGTAAMQAVFRLIDRLADSDVPVVIFGESGTGKELVARAIHDAGARKGRAFVAENCGAIPEALLESVLFGHAKGAFTGAHRATPGLFEAADGGTIFLDEIGEMSPGMQTKLLRVLQEGELRRVGDTATRKIEVRVIAASNRDLEAMVAAGTFRKDLLYRIRVVKIDLPPLRSRPEDLTTLVEHFLARYDKQRRLTVSAAAMRALARYAWPGNIRELENEVQRWVALVETRVEPADLTPAIVETKVAGGREPDDFRLRPRLDRLERELIDRAMAVAQGNQTRAAALLGLSRFGLQKKLRRLAEGVPLAEEDEP